MNHWRIIGAALVSLPLAAGAQGKDELWEVTSQMSMPGLPAGMGASTQRVCQDKDPAKQEVQGRNMENCKVTDRKQSGNRMTMTLACPQGTAVFENTYNAARTEYQGTMRMKTREGEMTMAMTGRKVGSCDAAAERGKQQAQVAAIQGQAAQAQAEMKKQYDMQIRQCDEAVQTMEYSKLGLYGQCKQHPESCNAMAGQPETKAVLTACNTRQAEYCRRYRTEEGFLKAKADPRAAEACGLSVDQVKAELCPGAAQKESLAFLGRYCLAEAKPLAERHCAGRDFTALRAKGGKGDKYDDFCTAYLSNASLAASARREAPRSESAGVQTPKPADAVTEGINQGINKIRGLFGR
jgi:hypothetical protein